MATIPTSIHDLPTELVLIIAEYLCEPYISKIDHVPTEPSSLDLPQQRRCRRYSHHKSSAFECASTG
ncbi:hypothetical protein N7532_004049 [Penicillium argentinense]|uniref:F-box domain-containing protein n=1 Tax=Penicillium argentinense TaxID=1131581 RepID=A0A9W9FP36_9EURO|nr:uncharacterized protein N7532_004049 [Penicillium argentinense]KAJ5103520.1 hypothetical protein N7532_004049 [Penicillium argentinense]